MTNNSYRALCALVAFVIVAAVSPVRAQDPVKAAPAVFKERLNNSDVRVIEFTSTPGQKDPMHSHPGMVVYVLAGGKLKSTAADGTSKIMEFAAGDVRWMDPTSHSTENIGTTNMKMLLVDVKHPKK